MDVNVKGIFLCSRAVVPYMRQQGGGKIINIGSSIWLFGGSGIPHYVASKAAVTGLTRALARELGADNIKVNTLAPGGTASGAVVTRDEHSPQVVSNSANVLGRREVPEDLTGTMVFLASDDSDYITGQMLTVNGGAGCTRPSPSPFALSWSKGAAHAHTRTVETSAHHEYNALDPAGPISCEGEGDMRLQDKVVIVTGAAHHIGQAYAVRAAQEGAKVVICDIRDCSETAEMVAEAGGEVLSLRTDVSNEEDTLELARQAVERFGRIDCIVNNAGLFDGLHSRTILNTDMEEWDRVMNVNVKGIFLCCRAVVPQMMEQGYGKIINIGSGIWHWGGSGTPAYVSSKAAVTGLTRALARELGQYGIRVNTLAPGGTASGAVIARDDDSPQVVPNSGNLLGRREVPDDLTGTMVFLASEDSDYITGQNLTVNGGTSMW